jgi:hypothetical protein
MLFYVEQDVITLKSSSIGRHLFLKDHAQQSHQAPWAISQVELV